MDNLPSPFDKSMVYIKTPDNVHNNYGLCIWLVHPDQYVIDKFQRIALRIIESYRNILCINLRPFIQGKDKDWCYIELWNGTPYQDEILSIIQLLSVDMSCPWDII